MAIAILKTADIDSNKYEPDTTGFVFGTPEYYAEAERIAKEARSAFAFEFSAVTNVSETRNGETKESGYTNDYVGGSIVFDGKHDILFYYACGYDHDGVANGPGTLRSSISGTSSDDRSKEIEFIYAYANDGMLLAKVNVTEKIINTYEYDDRGHMTKAIAKFGNSKKTMFTTYEYDKYGRQTSSKSKFITTVYEYDDKNMTVTKKVERLIKGETEPKKSTTQLIYNLNGEIVKEICGKRETIYKYEHGICVESTTYYNHRQCGSTNTNLTEHK